MRMAALSLCMAAVLFGVAIEPCAAGGGSLSPVLDRGVPEHIAAALASLNMTVADLGFEKDVAEPRFVLTAVRTWLADPLTFPVMADRILAATAGEDAALWELAVACLEVSDRSPTPPALPALRLVPPENLDADLWAALIAFVGEAGRAEARLLAARQDLTEDEARHAAGSRLVDLFNAEDDATVRVALAADGLSSQLVARLVKESAAVDPEPAADRYLSVVRRWNVADALEAASILLDAARALERSLSRVSVWPETSLRVTTPYGDVYVGTTKADVYSGHALLIVDPAGDDTYRGRAGSANGLLGAGLSVVVDEAGDDRYVGDRILGPGSAVFGLALLMDRDGNDVYAATYAGQAAALFGVAILEDRAGADVYRAYAWAQGAGICGLGLLRDRGGSDIYELGLCGQAYAGVLGLGLLVDHEGNDRYLAGGRRPDYERHDDRYLSLAQGFATGMRPFAGGGMAALVDRAGNDVYQADVYGQGVGYWYAVGMLLDERGNDTYYVHQYGQGSGIHLSLGLLADGAGDDFYTGASLVQGNAHDYAVGFLFDHAGNDSYSAVDDAQGGAIHNALACLVDSGGNDSYFGRDSSGCQGVGHKGGKREYGALALLLDLGGRDLYTCGARNGWSLLRPSFGVVYDADGLGPDQGAGEDKESKP